MGSYKFDVFFLSLHLRPWKIVKLLQMVKNNDKGWGEVLGFQMCKLVETVVGLDFFLSFFFPSLIHIPGTFFWSSFLDFDQLDKNILIVLHRVTIVLGSNSNTHYFEGMLKPQFFITPTPRR